MYEGTKSKLWTKLYYIKEQLKESCYIEEYEGDDGEQDLYRLVYKAPDEADIKRILDRIDKIMEEIKNEKEL